MKPQKSPELTKFLATATGLFDILPDAVTVTSLSGKIIYANPSAAKFLDRPLEDLIGRKAESISESISKDIFKIFADGYPQIGVRDSINGKGKDGPGRDGRRGHPFIFRRVVATCVSTMPWRPP